MINHFFSFCFSISYTENIDSNKQIAQESKKTILCLIAFLCTTSTSKFLFSQWWLHLETQYFHSKFDLRYTLNLRRVNFRRKWTFPPLEYHWKLIYTWWFGRFYFFFRYSILLNTAIFYRFFISFWSIFSFLFSYFSVFFYFTFLDSFIFGIEFFSFLFNIDNFSETIENKYLYYTVINEFIARKCLKSQVT